MKYFSCIRQRFKKFKQDNYETLNFVIGMGLVLAIYHTHNPMYVMNINCNLFLIDYDSRLCDTQNRVFVKDYRTFSLVQTTK